MARLFLHSCHPHDESLANNLLDIDVPLKAIFVLRVQEMGATPRNRRPGTHRLM